VDKVRVRGYRKINANNRKHMGATQYLKPNEVTEKLYKAFEKAEKDWRENYRKGSLEWRKERVENIMKREGYSCDVEPKAISTHLSKWLGVRKDKYGNLQYAMRWHSGYTMNITDVKPIR